MSNKKQIKSQESIPSQIKHEISAIGLILLGVFIFISIFNPKTTGVIGYWLINVGLKYIIGEFMRFLPLFLLFTAIMLFIPKIKKKRATITLLLCFINFTIFYELLINKIISNYQFPPPIKWWWICWALWSLCYSKISWLSWSVGTLTRHDISQYNFSVKPFFNCSI